MSYKNQKLLILICLALCLGTVGCGKLWGGLYRYPSGGTSSTEILGIFVGAVGLTSASTGTCPAAAVASTWCTGGTFATGTADGAFQSIAWMTLDVAGNRAYVTDIGINRINKINLSTGAFIGANGRTTATTGTCTGAGAEPTWCTGGTFASGAGDGMYNGPSGLSLDLASGFLYMIDNSNHRLNKLNLNSGAFIGAVGNTTGTAGTCTGVGVEPTWCTGGTFGFANLDGAYRFPRDMTTDLVNGFSYVSDATNARIVKITTSTGAFVGAIGRVTASGGTCIAPGAVAGWCTGGLFATGVVDGSFTQPRGIVLDVAADYLYVVDQNNHRVVKIQLSTGAFIGAIGRTTASAGTCPAAGATNGWCTGGTFASGTADGMFSSPSGIAIDKANDNFFVSNLGTHRIDKYNLTTGVYIGSIGLTTASTGTCPSGAVASSWCTGGTFTSGAGDGMLNTPTSISIDTTNGNLYVADSSNFRLVKIR